MWPADVSLLHRLTWRGGHVHSCSSVKGALTVRPAQVPVPSFTLADDRVRVLLATCEVDGDGGLPFAQAPPPAATRPCRAAAQGVLMAEASGWWRLARRSLEPAAC